MKFYLKKIMLFFILTTLVEGQDTKVDILLEKVQQSKSKKEKQTFISELKIELARINKKERDESNAIIDAKKKLPLQLFNVEKIEK